MEVLLIGGTRFIGPRVVEEFLGTGADVTVFTRGRSEHPISDEQAVEHITGDRTNRSDLERARAAVEPDVVIDMVGFYPEHVREAVELFVDVNAYVFVSSVSAYADRPFPIVEDETPLLACSPEQATDESFETYGNRKAACERVVFEAVDNGLSGTTVRPVQVYGPGDPSGRMDYWIDRVERRDRVLVPGDGTNVTHQVFVDDVATAIRLIARHGEPGKGYNVGARQAVPLGRTIGRIAAAVGTSAEQVYSSERELVPKLAFDDFPVYRREPYAVDTDRLASLGWTATGPERAVRAAVEDYRTSDRDVVEHGPAIETETTIIEALTG